MFPLAHLGIGSAITRAYPQKLPFRFVLAGTVLPDCLDKPIFFALSQFESFSAAGWEAGKRGLAHTLLFVLLLALIARWKKSLPILSLCLGVATHLLLDVISKSTEGSATALGSLRVTFWPFLGFEFPKLSHGMHGIEIWVGELLGLSLLALQIAVPKFKPKII